MTTILSLEGESELISARRTESLDAPSIQALVTEATRQLFGRVDVVHLVEKASLAVTLVNSEDELLGHAAFYDYPNTPLLPSDSWETWVKEHYASGSTNAINALFMHYFVAKAEYSIGCANEIINTVFNAVPELHYVYLLVPEGVSAEPALSEMFSAACLRPGTKSPEDFSMLVCPRHKHAPVLHIRKARVQDHDDLTPIFNRHSDMLRHTYGDYFLAEMIEAQNDSMQCLAAEVNGMSVGFMSVSTDVNLELLNECFELGPFHGLRKPHPDDVTEAPRTPTPTPEPSPEPVEGEQTTDSPAPVADSEHAHGSPSNRSSTAGSQKSSGSKKDSETAIRPKLSESHLTGSTHSLVSDGQPQPGDEDVEEGMEFLDALDTQDLLHIVTPLNAVSALPTPQLTSPLVCYQKRFVPEYNGLSNAICIQLFCIDERYETRSGDFLNKVFELFPDYDFCIITVPHLVPEFPLLQQFVRITPRCPSTLAQELYVFNSAGLLSDFSVRVACSDDYTGVESLVAGIDLSENLLRDLRQFNYAKRDKDGLPIHAYVAQSLDQVVGVAIIRQEEDIEYIRSHYNIEDFIYFNHHQRSEHGHIHHFALNPVFAHRTKAFLKEVARLSKKTSLYYPVYPPYTDQEEVCAHSLVTSLNQLVPVRARRQVVYPLDRLGGNAPSERVLKQPTPYALYHFNRKLALEPKVTINARIVVVGASDVSLGFMETFAFCPHLRFNNITLISPHGLPGELKPNKRRDDFLSKSLCYDEGTLVRASLRTWVNVVYGKMTAIDRHKRHVVVDDDTIVPYDHVVVATGMQYQVPCPTDADITLSVTNNELPNSPDRWFSGDRPRNVFVLNDDVDAAIAVSWLEQHFVNKAGKALVYGNTLDAYSCVQSLLEIGLTADRVVFVQPPLQATSCFNNPYVQEGVDGRLREMGVEMHSGYYLAQWNDGNDADEVYAASFTSHTKPVRIECAAFFAFYKKVIDSDAFKAINDACLVYDGKLVIDSYFHTNDPSIRAAGTLTKFQRKYHADQWSHQNFNSKEVGMQLAGTMLTLFDPTLEPEQQPPPEVLKLIPMYRSPKVQYSRLPGDLYYLHIHKPDLNQSLETQMAQADYGVVLITGTPACQQSDYFRLHINQYQTVQTITCLSTQEFAIDNIRCLYGLHERYLNNLVARFKENLVKDLYEYFFETWALAIFHDRFPDFREEIRELMISRPTADIESMEERLRLMIEDDVTITRKNRGILQQEYGTTGAKKALDTRLLSFLTYNHYHLPMYAKPGMV